MAAPIKTITVNRKARHEYHLQDCFEAGIVLQGTEVKSIRDGNFSLTDSYVRIQGGETFLLDAHIAAYAHGNRENHDPKRARKLLLHRREIKKIADKTYSSGMTIVPTKAYFSSGVVKVEIAVARGKQAYDKREDLKKDADRRAIQLYKQRYSVW